MIDQEYNAVDELTAKKKKNGTHRIRPTVHVEGSGKETTVSLILPLSELQKARPGTGARHSLGFALGPVEVTLPDGRSFQLYSGWIAMTAR